MVRGLKPYTPGEQPDNPQTIKLNTNENPFAPPQAVLAQIQQRVNEQLRLYPEATHASLRQEAARVWHVAPEQIFVGNGSDEVLSLILRAFSEKGQALTTAHPSYSLYPVLAQMYGLRLRQSPVSAPFILNPEDLMGDQALTLIANPNAPTGQALSSRQIARIAQNNPGLVVVDEAYIGFGAESALGLVQQYDNLLLTRTFSKGYSLAGIRLGFAVGSESLIEALYRIKDSYNVNILSQAAGIAVFQNHKLFRDNFNMITNNREFITDKLISLGFDCTDSLANFVFCRHGQKSGLELHQNLKQKGILIRHFDENPIQDWLRITVGSMLQIKALLKALKDELT